MTSSTRNPLPPEPKLLEDLPSEIQRNIYERAYEADESRGRFMETVRMIQLNNNLRQMAVNNRNYYANLAEEQNPTSVTDLDLNTNAHSALHRGASYFVEGYNNQLAERDDASRRLERLKQHDLNTIRFYNLMLNRFERHSFNRN
tara:strand:+ start:3571 stop:4005 length:435 start_codon:yes stop_codon:yes gene_type:complete